MAGAAAGIVGVQLCRCRMHGLGQRGSCRCSHWVPLPCLILVVLLILWCTPLPSPYYASCDRPCHELDWPMICRYKMSLEMYESMSPACGQCSANSTHCLASGCVQGDKTRRTVLTANRMLPGPALKVCENDIVVVDVLNRAAGQSMAVHWGAQSQRESPFMDGVPQLTQCPINTHTTFQYKFRATEAGTHLWTATGSAQAEAVFGPLVVRQSETRDPQRALYDEDVHLFTVSMFGSALLVNGHDHHEAEPLVRGRRYRLRLLHAAGGVSADASSPSPGSPTWPISVSLGELPMTVVAVDGHAVRPKRTRTLSLWPGERADVVVSAEQPSAGTSPSYRLSVQHEAPGAPGLPTSPAHVTLPFKDLDENRKVKGHSKAGAVADSEVADTVFVADLRGLEPLPERLSRPEVDVQLYLPFDYQPLSGLRSDLSGPQPPTKPGSAPAAPGPADLPWPRSVARVCNISLSMASAPLLTQPRDAERTDQGGVPVCRGDGQPATCPAGLVGAGDQSCECTHVIRVPLGSTVEIVLSDQGGDGDRAHVFHLHGHSFWLVGLGAGRAGSGPRHHVEQPEQRGSWEALAAADKEGKLLQRHLDHPVRKDTVSVPHLGAVAIRFIADNPGYWLLRERTFFRWPSGLGVILQVGEEADLPAPPTDFPKCGSFVGPEFFLM